MFTRDKKPNLLGRIFHEGLATLQYLLCVCVQTPPGLVRTRWVLSIEGVMAYRLINQDKRATDISEELAKQRFTMTPDAGRFFPTAWERSL